MRRMMTLILGAVVTSSLLSGCTLLEKLRLSGDKPKPTVIPDAQPDGKPDVDSLVRYLNQNAKRIQSLQAKVDIDARQGRQPVSLGGGIAARGPRDFRMRASLLGTTAVDIGSNNEKFWYWIKQANPPHYYFCTYKDLAGGKVNVPFPVETDMVMAALNMAEYDTAGKYELKKGTDSWELIQDTVSPAGGQVKRVTVFRERVPTKPGDPQVTEHRLEDSRGTLICKATVAKVEVDRNSGGVVPKRLTIEWPAQSVKMTLSLEDIQVNKMDQGSAERSFTLGTTQGYDQYDLASGAVASPSSMRQASPSERRR